MNLFCFIYIFFLNFISARLFVWCALDGWNIFFFSFYSASRQFIQLADRKAESIYGIWRAKIFENKISKWECVRFSLIILVDFNFLFSAIVAAAAAAAVVVGFNLISFIPMWISTFSTNQKESMKEIRLCLRITKVRARTHIIPFHFIPCACGISERWSQLNWLHFKRKTHKHKYTHSSALLISRTVLPLEWSYSCRWKNASTKNEKNKSEPESLLIFDCNLAQFLAFLARTKLWYRFFAQNIGHIACNPLNYLSQMDFPIRMFALQLITF